MHRIDLIVIGGSAGALEVLLELMPQLPAELLAPIAIVLHQKPTQPSLVPQLLARACSRAVREPEDKEPLARGTVYVAPPNYHMLIERGGTIALSVDEPVHFSRPSIDVLFESAADALGRGVVGLVLSGSNPDGAEGLHRIAAAGGVALVQAPATAAHAVMPEAAARRVGALAHAQAHALAPREVAPFLSRLAGQEPLPSPLT
ncbi:MAG TPA: chemotaxis protein CheB [Kofleriaceae bacterium]|nr:chemotaxis protein CheB [Kofleriaceae bacterium]